MITVQLIDGAFLPQPHPVLTIEDEAVEIFNYDGLVVAGLGATVYAHPGITVRPEVGSAVHLAPGADVDEPLVGALERADYTLTSWTPPETSAEGSVLEAGLECRARAAGAGRSARKLLGVGRARVDPIWMDPADVWAAANESVFGTEGANGANQR